MFGSGLHFNSPGIVRVEKTFSVANNPDFNWLLVDSSFSSQNIILPLSIKGPSLIPFLCFVNGVNIDGGAAGYLYVKYYGDSVLAPSALFAIPLLGNVNEAYCSYSNEVSNFNNGATVWPDSTTRNTDAGICIAADNQFVSGDSLTVTLYCVQSGLIY